MYKQFQLLDLFLAIDNECRLGTKLYDKRDDFNFSIVNVPFICSNIPFKRDGDGLVMFYVNHLKT